MTEQSLVRADLLLALENAGAVTPTELRLPHDLGLDRYEAVGAMLGQLGSAVRWWVGDWLVYGEERFGSAAAQLSEALNLSAEGRQDYLRVALAVPPECRRPGLSWSHHRRVAARWLSPEQRDRLLDAAERDGLTSHELHARVEVVREQLDALPPGEQPEVRRAPRTRANLSAAGEGSRSRTGECEELAEVALAELRDDLLACGFPVEALSLTVGTGTAALVVTVGTEEAAA